jgi:hypothetical protein
MGQKTVDLGGPESFRDFPESQDKLQIRASFLLGPHGNADIEPEFGAGCPQTNGAPSIGALPASATSREVYISVAASGDRSAYRR